MILATLYSVRPTHMTTPLPVLFEFLASTRTPTGGVTSALSGRPTTDPSNVLSNRFVGGSS